MTPQLSVIMGAYNAEKYIGRAIGSILSQSFTDFEFIIINDGSTDTTGEIIDHYAANDPRIIVVHQDNIGHANSLNKALKLARAPLIARMDADDITLPGRFAAQIEYMRANNDVAVVGSSIRMIDENDTILGDVIYDEFPEVFPDTLLNDSPLAHPTVMMRKNVISDLGGYRAILDPTEDYDLWMRVVENHKIANLGDVYLLYRQHPDKLSYKKSEYQTLCKFVLQLASRVRRHKGFDPIDTLDVITPHTLSLFNLSSEEEAELLFHIFALAYNSAIQSNSIAAYDQVMKRIKDTARQMNNIYMLELMIQRQYLLYYDHKRFFKVIKLLLESLFIRPIFSMRLSLNFISRRWSDVI